MLLLFAVATACKKSFTTSLSGSATNYLAVDGTIISGDSTFITLSRTTAINDTNQLKSELKAAVSVEDDKGTLFNLKEQGKGIYFLPVTNFDMSRTYRLDIKTKDGKIYQSDFVPVKKSPPIDSVYYHANDELNVQFFVDTHDPTNNTRYYRWDYKEVWRYVSFYRASFIYSNGQIVNISGNPGFPDNSGYYCYRHDYSNQVFIGSSANQSQDIIKKQLLASLPDTSEKISEVYAIIVSQYALTAEGLKYYQALKSNTEQLGSIFDPQPSFVKGNIHCVTSPTDRVMGFVSASTVTSKMIMFKYSDLGAFKIGLLTNQYPVDINSNGQFYYGAPNAAGCPETTQLFEPASTFDVRAAQTLGSGKNLLVDQYFVAPTPLNTPPWQGYFVAPRNCVDCTLKGGTSTRPSYFPVPF